MNQMTQKSISLKLGLGASNHQIQTQLSALRENALAAAEKQRIEREIDEQNADAQVVLDLLEPITKAFEKNATLRGLRGNHDYLRCYRSVAHLLPVELRFTVRGTRIINAVLERVSAVADLMDGPWKALAEENVAAAQVTEDKRIRDEQSRAEKDLDVISAIRSEIVTIMHTHPQVMCVSRGGRKVPMIRYYAGLFRYLRDQMVHPFRGSRGVRCIHSAIRAQIQWSNNWDTWMEKDLAHFVKIEHELANKNRENAAKKRSKRNGEQRTVHQRPENIGGPNNVLAEIPAAEAPSDVPVASISEPIEAVTIIPEAVEHAALPEDPTSESDDLTVLAEDGADDVDTSEEPEETPAH